MRIFAAPSDLQEWTQEEPPATALRDLRSASILISRLTSLATFEVDDADEPMPIDRQVRNALRDATCAQAAWFIETGDTSGAASTFVNLSLGSFSSSTGGSQGKATGDTRVSVEALDILAQAGLLLTGPGNSW